jgi:hypothetical protein
LFVSTRVRLVKDARHRNRRSGLPGLCSEDLTRP